MLSLSHGVVIELIVNKFTRTQLDCLRNVSETGNNIAEFVAGRVEEVHLIQCNSCAMQEISCLKTLKTIFQSNFKIILFP